MFATMPQSQGSPSAGSFFVLAPVKNIGMEADFRIPMTESKAPVMPRSVIKPVLPSIILSSAVGQWVCVPGYPIANRKNNWPQGRGLIVYTSIGRRILKQIG